MRVLGKNNLWIFMICKGINVHRDLLVVPSPSSLGSVRFFARQGKGGREGGRKALWCYLRCCLCPGGHRGAPASSRCPSPLPARTDIHRARSPALTGIYRGLEQVISAQSWLRESLLLISPSAGSDGSADFRRLIEPEQRPQTAPSARPGDGNFRANGLLSHQFKAVLFFSKLITF